jgi:hypothetical protein
MAQVPDIHSAPFNFDVLLSEFQGTSAPLEFQPNIVSLSKAFDCELAGCKATSRPLDFCEDNFYVFCRRYRFEASPGLFQEFSTLLQVCGVELGQSKQKKQSEEHLGSCIQDIEKLDSLHFIASVGYGLRIWERSHQSQFLVDASASIWQHTGQINLLRSRKSDRAVLIAGHYIKRHIECLG